MRMLRFEVNLLNCIFNEVKVGIYGLGFIIVLVIRRKNFYIKINFF